ncbi:MAG: glycine zipper 2TM domain-containing protein [Amphritea sp.]
MTKLITVAIATLGLLATSVEASGRHDKHHNAHRDYAKVVHVQPIVVHSERRVPHRECWDEQVRYEEPRQHRNSYTAPILGGIIGGAIGNELGHNKSNKRVGAAVGAVLGASIGHDVTRDSAYNGEHSGYRTETRCTVQHDVEYYERVTGYNVTYRYHGRTYHTRTNNHPGKKIRVRVNIVPVS